MEIVDCPKCGRPRALGHRCPSCGDTATDANEQSAAPETDGSWPTKSGSWLGAAPTGGQPQEPIAPAATWTPLAPQPQRAAPGKKRWGLLATVIVAVAVIAVVAVVAVVLTTGGAAIVEETASVASTPDKGHDLAAQSLLRNAMTAMDAAFIESADFTVVTKDTLKSIEPAIVWVPGRSGVCSAPSGAAKAQGNAVAWACTGRMTYELGAWSASGVEFGVRVDKAGGGTTYYRGGSVATW